ncbi:MAG: hypothetical protein GXP63_00330 [DPANN group archaeon]|nr:hypothetical protein [DPANN group archaeon]
MTLTILALAILFILSSITVFGADVALVVQYPDGNVHTECLSVGDNADGFQTLEASSLPLTWSQAGAFGHALCRINGVGDNAMGAACEWGNESWGFFIDDNGWKLSPVGFDTPGNCWNTDFGSIEGKYCAKDGDMIGFMRTSYDESFNPLSFPSTVNYEDVCSRMAISDIDVKVDGKKDSNLKDGDRIRKEAKPESDVEFKVKVDNLYGQDGPDIENVEITVTIQDIDDGDNLDEYSDDFDIRPGDTEKKTLKFHLPTFLEEGDYPVIIEAVGRDENGKRHEARAELTLKVNKDRHSLVIDQAFLNPEVLSCEDSTPLRVRVINFGEDEEDSVRVVIQNADLGIFFERSGIDLEADDEDDSVYEETFIIDRPQDAKDGTYDLQIDAYYDDTRLEDTKNIPLKISGCILGDRSPQGTTSSGEQAETGNQRTVVVETTPAVTGNLVAQPSITYGPVMQKGDFWSSSMGIMLLVLLNLLLIAGVILLLTIAFRRR